MKVYCDKSEHAITELRYKGGAYHKKYFHLYCDVCKVSNDEMLVDTLCEEEGYPDGDYCWSCQRSMIEQGFVGEDKSVYFKRGDCDG